MCDRLDAFRFLEKLFFAAVDAAQPERVIADHLPKRPKGRVVAVGAGKASAQMARAFEVAWRDAYGEQVQGVVVTRYGYACECDDVEVLEASHPVPDAAGLHAAERLLETVSGLGQDDLVVALISGGGSALLPCPPDGLGLEDEIAVNEALLASGAPISAMNTVRKHVSRIKGGRLASAAAPAQVCSLLVSDIPGDLPQFIASGPTVADAADRREALAIIDRYSLALPTAVIRHVESEASAAPHPDDDVFKQCRHEVVASAGMSLDAAARLAEGEGFAVHVLSDAVEGEAREAGRFHAAIVREILTRNRPFTAPCLLLSGGETTVTLRGKGKGGRNTEFLLAFAQGIEDCTGVYALAADTDGIDGSESNAGAFADGETVARMRAAGIDPAQSLANNDAWSAFESIGANFSPGPTGTNVNDFRAVLIEAPRGEQQE